VATVLVVGGCGGTKTVTETVGAKTAAGPPSELVEFGYVKSLEREDDGYRMRFDPAWFLSGETAKVAAAEDGAVEPGEPVPNDNYRVDEGHRQLTYLVPATAEVTVLADGPNGTPIEVSQLADLVAGKNPLDHPLFEPLSTGFWIRVDVDTVRSLDQQYQP
ncbi:MAG TPA: hypothetical protein VFT18_08010, partial [Gaiellaceae bacterium]|nr:hypothetical protein [Gaiellaceae bacterium]